MAIMFLTMCLTGIAIPMPMPALCVCSRLIKGLVLYILGHGQQGSRDFLYIWRLYGNSEIEKET